MLGRNRQISMRVSHSDTLLGKMQHPIQLNSGGFLLCLSGESEVVVDLKRYKLKRWDIIVVLPYTVLQLLNSSNNFDGVIMGTGLDLFAKIDIKNRVDYFTRIKENPCISLTVEEGEKILAIYNFYERMQGDSKHPFRDDIDESIFRVIFYETAAIYTRRSAITEQQCSRDNIIFNLFISHLFNNYKEHRELAFYAQLQNITPSHLSRVVKRVSGQNASNWIINYTILNIKVMLQDINISIYAIVDEFNFPNSSFFSQYFKKYCGVSPSKYRSDFKR